MTLPTPAFASNFNGNANDEIGSNNGTISGATLSKGRIAWAYSGDGANDQISFATFGTGIKFLRILFNATTTADYIAYQASGFAVYFNGSNQLVVEDASGNTFVSTSALSTDTEYDLMVVYDGGSSAVYLDGSTLAGTNNLSDASVGHASNTVYLFSDGSTNYFQGTISGVQVATSGATSGDASGAYNSGTPKIYTATNGWIDESSLEYGALHYLKCENTTYTCEVTGLTGTESGTSTTTGIINNGINVQNADYFYPFGSDVQLTANDDFVLSFWMKSSSSDGFILGGSSDSDYSSEYFYFRQTVSYELDMEGSGSSNVITAAPTTDLGDGSWHHVLIEHDATDSTARLYIDGNTTPEATDTIDTVGNYCQLSDIAFGTLGNRNNAGDRGTFICDEIYFRWGSLASTSLVSSLYNSGSPGSAQQYPFPAAGTGFLISSINGVDPALISNINGVPIANIAKWNGTTIQ